MTTSSNENAERQKRWDDPEGAVEQAQARAAKSAAWSTEMMTLTGTGEAERGGITVQVDADGILRAVTVSDVVAAKGGRVVELGVLAAVRSAQDQVAEQAKTLTAQAWGADSPTTHVVSQEYAANRSVAPDEGPAPRTPNNGGQW